MTERDCAADRPGLERLAHRLVEEAVRFKWNVLRAKADHAYPSGTGEPVSGGGPSDPTASRVMTHDPGSLDLKKGGNKALSHLTRVNDDYERQPVTPDQPCRNCGWKTATHPKSNPRECEACDRYRRRNHGTPRPRDLWEAELERERAKESDRRRQRAS